jgi:NAD(P)-dependent dehydrogenase (short-subunit alcohol dehydrogenase family)
MAGGGRLDGKVALVTGSTRGIGEAIARRFAAEGAGVLITGRTQAAGRRLQEEIEREGGQALYVPTDLAHEDQIARAVRAAVERFGRLTTLVNNAAPTELMGPGRTDRSLAEISDAAWDAILRVGLKALVWTSRHAIPHIAQAGGGSVVNVSSAAGTLGVGGLDAYTATKGAIDALTRSMAVEFAPRGIRVNCIAPGMVLTSPGAWKMMEHPLLGPATRALHLTRLGRPEDVAAAAAFLASDDAAFITGVHLPVDGGATARMNVPDISALDLELD